MSARGVDAANRKRVGAKRSSFGFDWLYDTWTAEDETIVSKLAQTSEGMMSRSYWEFSNDDIIKYEIRAQLDIVRKVAGREKISLVTYSNGGFLTFGFLATHPEYGRKHIDSVMALAPAVYVNRLNLDLALTGIYSHIAPSSMSLIPEGVDSLARKSITFLCKGKLLRYSVCKFLLDSIYGFSDKSKTSLELDVFDHIGRPISSGSLRQIAQVSLFDRFQHTDLFFGNWFTYEGISPPEYRLQDVRVPSVHLFSGNLDALADERGIDELAKKLTSCRVERERIYGYNHLDFITAHDVAESVNAHVLYILEDRLLKLRYN